MNSDSSYSEDDHNSNNEHKLSIIFIAVLNRRTCRGLRLALL